MIVIAEEIEIQFKELVPDKYIDEINQFLEKNDLDAYAHNRDVTTIEGRCLTETLGTTFGNIMSIVNRICKETGIEAEGRITISCRGKSAYILTENGKSYEYVDSEALTIIDSDTDLLIKELENRGYTVTKAA